MPTGLKVPVGVNKSGGAAVETNEAEQNKKLLRLAVLEGGDDNPFQSLGGFGELIYSIKSPSVRTRAESILGRILIKFAERIQLSPDEPIVWDSSVVGELTLSISYIDLLTNTAQEFTETFRNG